MSEASSTPQVPAKRKPGLLTRNWWCRFLALDQFLAGAFLMHVALSMGDFPAQLMVGVLAGGCLAGAFATVVLTEG